MNYFCYGEKELNHLKGKDKRLKEAIDTIGFIQRPVYDDLFEALISSITSQQISTKAAKSVWNRLVVLLGEVSPEAFVDVSVEMIQSCGMSMRKAMYIKEIADKVRTGVVDLHEIAKLDDEMVIVQLSALKGIGKWTAQMLLLFCLQRPDVVSWDDLAIRRGMMRLYRHKTLTKVQFERYCKRYSPYGSVASLYLWKLSENVVGTDDNVEPLDKKKKVRSTKKADNAKKKSKPIMDHQ